MDDGLKGARDGEVFARAAPGCVDCGTPVRRVEHSWHLDEDGNWRLRAFMVCGDGHRIVVPPLA
jgi:hypothetical protein